MSGGAPAQGGGSGSGGMRFYLLFDIKDQSGSTVQQIGVNLGMIGTKAESSAKHVEQLGHRVHSLAEGLREMQHLSHAIENVGRGTLGVIGAMTQGVLHHAEHFEKMRAELHFAFQEQTEQAWTRVNRFAADSVYSVSEITTAVSALRTAFRTVDPTELTPRFRTATGSMVSSLEALSDASAGAGRDLGFTIGEVERAMMGHIRPLAYMYRLGGHEVEQIQRGIAAASNDQEKYNAIVQVLAGHWGGAQAAMANTFNFIRRQLPDLYEQIMAAIGTAALEPIKGAVLELINFLRASIQDPNFVRGLSEAFAFVGQAISWTIRRAIDFARWMRGVMSASPGLAKGLVAVGVAFGVVALLAGKVLAVMSGLGLAAFAFAAAGPVLLAVLKTGAILLALLPPAILLIVTTVEVLKMAWERDFGGITTFIRRTILLVGALTEAFEDWGESGATISKATADRLKAAGLLEFYNNLVGWIERARLFAVGAWEQLSIVWGYLRTQAEPAIDALGDSLGTLFHTVGRLLGVTEELGPAAGTNLGKATSAGVSFGASLMNVVIPTVNFLVSSIKGIAWVIDNVVEPSIRGMHSVWQQMFGEWRPNADTFRSVLAFIGGAIATITILVGILAVALGVTLALALTAVAVAFSPIIAAVYVVYSLVRGISRMVDAVREGLANWSVNHSVTQAFGAMSTAWNRVAPSTPAAQNDADLNRQYAAYSAGQPSGAGGAKMTAVYTPTPVNITTQQREEKRSGSAAATTDKQRAMETLAAATELGNKRLEAVMTRMVEGQTRLNQLASTGAFRTVLSNDAVADAARQGEAGIGERRGRFE